MEYISSKYVKIRKPHKCWGCRREFSKGEILHRVTSSDMGKISSIYWCDICNKIISQMDHSDTEDGFMYGEIIDNINDEDRKLYDNSISTQIMMDRIDP